MSGHTSESAKAFVAAQIAAWNARDKETFMALYRKAAPGKLTIEYVGRPPTDDAYAVLEHMWEDHNAICDVEEALMHVNGTEVACHNHNRITTTGQDIETIEIYAFNGDDLHIRYFTPSEG